MAFPDPTSLDKDGGTNDRTFVRIKDGHFAADDGSLGAPHEFRIRHKTFQSASGKVDQHIIEFLRTEEDAGDNIARAEMKLTINVPQKVLTSAHLLEMRYQLVDLISGSVSWDRILRGET